MKRKIIEINEDLCNGCELCVSACHEGAIQMVDGKARLISDAYCDGLGDCLPECPTGAIQMIERMADPYDEELVMAKIKEQEASKIKEQEASKESDQDLSTESATAAASPCGCPGMAMKTIQRDQTAAMNKEDDPDQHKAHDHHREVPSELSQWPVQLNLIHPQAPYLKEADLLIAADCTAYAYGDFHRDFIKGKVTLIGCPKLDDNRYYLEKLTEIFRINNPKSITVTRMQVPCCGGIVSAVRQAMLDARVIVPYREVIIGTDGRILQG